MPRRGGGAGALGILVLLGAAGLAIAAFTRKEPELPDGEPPAPPPPENGVNGDGRLAFEPVLLGEPVVNIWPF